MAALPGTAPSGRYALVEVATRCALAARDSAALHALAATPDLDTDALRVHWQIGRAFYALGDAADAAQVTADASPGYRAGWGSHRGMVLLAAAERGAWAEVEGGLVDPDVPATWRAVALARMVGAGHAAEALAAQQRFCSTAPEDARAESCDDIGE